MTLAADVFERLRGKFIVFDGIDGAGKGAQLERMEQALTERGIGYIRTRDPGGTEIGDRIRHVLLDYDLSKMDVRCEAFLFMASRAQLISEVIRPALERNEVVLGDRFVSATCAYQGAAGYDPKKVIELADYAIEGLWPDLTLVLDMGVEDAFERTGRTANGSRNKRTSGAGQSMLFHDVQTDAMEARPRTFHEKVRELFLQLPSFYPRPVTIVSGNGSVDDVHLRIQEAIRDASL